MEELMNKFDECLDCWIDLPEYVYSEEYRKTFFEFAKRRIVEGHEVTPMLAIMTLHHETEGLPYFEFNRE